MSQFVAIVTQVGQPSEEGASIVVVGTTREDAIALARDEANAQWGDDGEFEDEWNAILAEEANRPRYSEQEFVLHIHEVR